MPRAKKIATGTYDLLDKFCDETGITKTTATEKILDEYFKKPKEERNLLS